MSNLIDYVEASQYDSLYDKELNVLDILALTEITYLPFDGIVSPHFSIGETTSLHRLAVLFDQQFQKKYPPLGMVNGNRLTLLSHLSTYKRYKHIKAFAFVNDYNLDSQKQFAATTYQTRPKEFVVVFRGTDDTLIGWKEDFHMTYMAEIPAQRTATEYLTKILTTLDGRVTVAGHSKGGNLAIYAASQIAPELQNKLQTVYSFDGPGVHASILYSSGFKQIEDKITSIIPQGSIVGMMLETPENALIVKSKANGLMQHVSFSWEVEQDQFKFVPAVTKDSLQVDQTLKTWTASLSEEELKDFFDLFFGIFIQAGILRFSDVTIDTLGKIQKVIQNSQQLTLDQKAMLERITRLLIDTRVQIWKEGLPDLPPLPDLDLTRKLPSLSDLQLQEKLAHLPKFPKVDIPDSIRNLLPDKHEKDES